MIMPLVTRLVTATGWSSFVMQKFLTLCERAGIAYPLDAFITQANAVLGSIANAKGTGPGRCCQLARPRPYSASPTPTSRFLADQAQELLKVLDELVDLGDRRSAALEQTEAFRGVQGLPATSAQNNQHRL